jgi:hypothetical protein
MTVLLERWKLVCPCGVSDTLAGVLACHFALRIILALAALSYHNVSVRLMSSPISPMYVKLSDQRIQSTRYPHELVFATNGKLRNGMKSPQLQLQRMMEKNRPLLVWSKFVLARGFVLLYSACLTLGVCFPPLQ